LREGCLIQIKTHRDNADAVVDRCLKTVGFEDLLDDLALVGVKMKGVHARGRLELDTGAKIVCPSDSAKIENSIFTS
jgi:hypothetical protein